MDTLEYVVIGVYFAVLISIGLVFRTFNANVGDYFKGGARGTWWLVGVSSFVAGISAYTFTGAAGAVYEAGWSILVIYIGNALGYLVNYLYFAARFRQLRRTAGPEVLRDRFGRMTEQFYAWISFPSGIIGSAMLLYSLAIFISSVFRLNMQLLIVTVGAVVIFYSVIGGRWAIMATDFVQCLIMMGLTLLVGGLSLIKTGGFSGLFELIEQQGLNSDYSIVNSPERFNGAYTWFWAGAMLLNCTLTANNLGAAGRYFSVKDGKEAKKAALLSMVLMLAGCIIWFLPPMVGRLFYADQVTAMTQLSNPQESAFAVACMNLRRRHDRADGGRDVRGEHQFAGRGHQRLLVGFRDECLPGGEGAVPAAGAFGGVAAADGKALQLLLRFPVHRRGAALFAEKGAELVRPDADGDRAAGDADGGAAAVGDDDPPLSALGGDEFDRLRFPGLGHRVFQPGTFRGALALPVADRRCMAGRHRRVSRFDAVGGRKRARIRPAGRGVFCDDEPSGGF